MKEIDVCLKPTSTIDSDSRLIVKKADEIAGSCNTAIDKAIRLFYWVRDEISYTPVVPMEIFDDFSASAVLQRGTGFCVEKATLLAALARAQGIPARIHLADIRNHLISERLMEALKTDLFSCHGYCELYLGGRWVKATPAFDIRMCEKNRIVPVEFDGIQDAVFHSHNLDGQPHIEYVADHGAFTNVPVDFILMTWLEVYGDETMERVTQYMEEQRVSA
jgi:transglutaminase-like putative cysteine protease